MVKERIGKDPNNTRWTKDTTTFGHRILRSHGWTPGSFLGVENAPHAELHSAASASYIRVAMKDDAGGLGFRPGYGGDNDIAGMDEVKGIFDRLNGIVETDAAREARERKKAMVYLGQRLGGVAFISGGYLEQEGWDKVDELVNAEAGSDEAAGKRKAGEEGAEEAPRKKRRRDDGEKADKKTRREERRRRKEKSAESESSPADSSSSSDDADEASPAKKSSKREKSAPSSSTTAQTSPDAPETRSERKERREERRVRKEERRLRRERKQEKRERLKGGDATAAKSKKKRRKSASEIAVIVTGTSTPVDSDAPARTRASLGGRHIHHARKVAAKNSVMSNAAALAQILAI